MTPDQLLARVLFQDSNLIVLDKPPGLAVHGGPKTPEHLEGMLEALRFNLRQAPRLAHRLDRDTSGCLLLARHDKALSRLGRLFSAGQVKKTYWAVVDGAPSEDAGQITLPLLKVSTQQTGWRMVVDPTGQTAITDWRVLGRADGQAWVELSPQSGRTHQIRVHCASGLGCPIVGDPVYGPPPPTGLALHLHSRQVVAPYWADRPPIIVDAPPPEHMRPALLRLGWVES